MHNVRRIDLEGGELLIQVVELEDDRGVRPAGSPQQIAEKAKAAFDSMWEKLRPMATRFGTEMATLGPKEVEVKFGLSLGTDLNWFIGSAEAGATFEVTMKWDN
jgi:hypothetical protein